jgi:hypothetical protein
MNMSMTFSTEIKQNVVAIFVINGMLSSFTYMFFYSNFDNLH